LVGNQITVHMKSLRVITLLLSTLFISSISFGQSKEDKARIKELEKAYTCFSNHKPYFKADEKLAMMRMHIVFKLTTAKISKAMSKNDYIKAKSSSGAYGMLSGVSEEDLQKITDQVMENYIKRMKEELGIEVITWSTFKDSPNSKKLKEQAFESRELYSKSQGLGYALSYDDTPPSGTR
jgi:hypothetical protein